MRNKRKKNKLLTDEIYGARLPFEHARILIDYARSNNIDRSDVIRLCVKNFVLRNQLLHKKDAYSEHTEKSLTGDFAHLNTRLEEITSALSNLLKVTLEIHKGLAFFIDLNQRTGRKQDAEPDGLKGQFERLYKHQHAVLEKVLHELVRGSMEKSNERFLDGLKSLPEDV